MTVSVCMCKQLCVCVNVCVCECMCVYVLDVSVLTTPRRKIIGGMPLGD